ncbi:MAG: hypothetical protein LLF75_04830 [Eubacteriales bacterium]|nr:hypothetical protein [Eubacteriales bacterium]
MEGIDLDIRFDEASKKGKSPTTRLYTQNKNGEAEETARTGRVKTNRRTPDEPHVRVDKPEMTVLGRVGLIISGFILSGMILFTLAGYERISRAYADINALNTEKDSTKLRINELDVQIECAVTIQDAQKIAEAYGMRYPEKSQYVRIGDPLPFSGGAPTEAPQPDTTATTQPETTPEPDSGGTGDNADGGGGQPPAGG